MRGRRLFRIFLWALALGWVAVLFVLSGQDGVASSRLSRRFTALVLRLLPAELAPLRLEAILRKIAHGAVFAVEGFLLGLAAMHSLGRGRGLSFALLGCAGMAVLNELHQKSAAGRSCEGRDMLIDMGGAALGALFSIVIMLFIDKLSRARVTNAN